MGVRTSTHASLIFEFAHSCRRQWRRQRDSTGNTRQKKGPSWSPLDEVKSATRRSARRRAVPAGLTALGRYDPGHLVLADVGCVARGLGGMNRGGCVVASRGFQLETDRRSAEGTRAFGLSSAAGPGSAKGNRRTPETG